MSQCVYVGAACMRGIEPARDWHHGQDPRSGGLHTGLLEQGRHSVGVQRQFTGSAGKITNCQIAAALSVATAHEAVPIDVALYPPERWANDAELRKKARIPDGAKFEMKPELALEMIRDACLDGVPGKVLLADSAYGVNADFRAVDALYGFDYAAGIHSTTTVHLLDALGRARSPAIAL